jgi:hypothetical protein
MVDACGSRLTPKLFIQVFRDVTKLSPARFLTLRLHLDRYKELHDLADIPESIQVGQVPGMLGRMITKINCIKPPIGVSDGIQILIDCKADPSTMTFEIHGIPEMVVKNLAV